MLAEIKPFVGKALTVCGPVEPKALGKVMMHEHFDSAVVDYEKNELIVKEDPLSEERRNILMNEAAPFLKQCTEHGCRAIVDATNAPNRVWPDIYPKITRATGMHIILCTGFYRELELGTYWAKKPEWQIWPFVRQAPVEQLEEMCIREIVEGIHGTPVHAGAIKLASSRPEMTPAEEKAFRAGARAQKKTGVHITTHCTMKIAAFSQLLLLDEEEVDLNRVSIGHIGCSLREKTFRKACIPWMKRGATFLPTNLSIGPKDPKGERWRPLIEGIHELFDAGVGDRLGFGLDCSFISAAEVLKPGDGRFILHPPWLYMFTHTLPAFRKLGLTAEEEDWIMRRNPQRILPVQ
jgi:phosphotriesterase-related protein